MLPGYLTHGQVEMGEFKRGKSDTKGLFSCIQPSTVLFCMCLVKLDTYRGQRGHTEDTIQRTKMV